jgi:hypothetical protein
VITQPDKHLLLLLLLLAPVLLLIVRVLICFCAEQATSCSKTSSTLAQL